ncbi:hypothetical protein BSZ37_13040 [Rubrivirga marina]|uniref:TPM domain-containing protein n=1 Tax=Rubrivirga marina TaxID=1196024 RepID=A0A271J1G3_9BACT|nr:hypothetical protein BSZ37_13040 [Rubrivirga marina]
MRAGGLLAVLLLAVPGAAALDVPPLTGRVVDLADVLDPATEAALVARLAAHEDSTSNQVVVLTIPSLEGEILEPYATRVFRTWELGQADRDNGILLLVAVADRELRIEVGYGLEGSLTDATSGSIIRAEIVPRFRDGDFDAGVVAGVDAILGAIDGSYAPRPLAGLRDGQWKELILFGGMTLLFAPFFLVPAVLHGFTWETARVQTITGSVFVLFMLGMPLFVATDSALLTLSISIGVLLVLLLLCFLADRILEANPKLRAWREHWQKKQAAFKRARSRGATTVVVDGRPYSVPTSSSSGGFSGGGGSSGGGGASGSW